MVLDLGRGRDSAPALKCLTELAQLEPAPAALVLSERDTLWERVEAAQRGAAAFLRRPAPPGAILDIITRSLATDELAGTRILLLDDDPAILELVTSLLRSRGVDVVAVNDPVEFWPELTRRGADLVVLDHDMPNFTGVEICRTLRADTHWRALPVLFLSARRDAETLQNMFAAGADDFVPKPVVAQELVARIRSRLDRARLHAAVAAGPGPGGMPGRALAGPEVSRMLLLAGRRGEPLAVAHIAPLDFDRISGRLGRAATEQVLARLGILLESMLPPGDVVAWWGRDEFLATFFGEDADGAAALLRPALDAISREPVPLGAGAEHLRFAAGIAAFPDDGADLGGLTERAAAALMQARNGDPAAGGGAAPLVTASAQAGGQVAEVIDVAIVEDDHVLAELLAHALGTRGYSVRIIGDGESAVELLAGASPALLARVILLDVDLPGRSGLNVLRSLASGTTLSRTRVVVLTVRSSEDEILKSLELGASDHVAKPFSVPVLMHRVRSLLERDG